MIDNLRKYCQLLFTIIFVMIGNYSWAQSIKKDSIVTREPNIDKTNNFYDSLKVRASKKKITRLIYDFVVTGYKPVQDTISETHAYYATSEGKTIGDIKFLRLPVFGPTVQDTSHRASSWLERAANSIHTRSDLHNLSKNLIIKRGETIDADMLYENERIFRTLPHIRDARFIIVPDTMNNDVVNLLLITQDRFSIGVTGFLDGSSAAAEIYNRNFFGFGHEASVRFVGHLTRMPYIGFESFYKINNINGKFLSFAAGYSNTYRNEGAVMNFEKPLIRVSDNWAYGINAYTYKRTSELPELIRPFRDIYLRYNQLTMWGARNFQIGTNENTHSQITIAANYINRQFKERPFLPKGEPHYFSDTKFYLTGISWSQRWYMPDKLIYGYGITEDIPKGFKNELVFGFDDNENGERFYAHFFLSNGNFLRNRPGYLFLYGGASTYFNYRDQQQGLIEGGINFITKLHGNGNARFRHFIRIDYMRGVNRFEIENLYFEKNNLIRGFESKQIFGKERLNINFESVYFQRRDFYRFNIAFFTFIDLGLLGKEQNLIFKESYYGGFGAGMRLHNESLVLKTILVRLAIYPNHPKDVGLLGLLITEQTRQNFYNFQPGPPQPRRFQ
jgi:hypothetical protein